MHLRSLTIIGDRAWSYNTCIMDYLPDGRSLGNATKYSATSTQHQNAVDVTACDVVVGNVPKGTTDLTKWYLANLTPETPST